MSIDPRITPEMEQMAIAILRGDYVSAVAARDMIDETREGKRINPIKYIKNINNIRIVIWTKESVNMIDLNRLTETIQAWLANDQHYPLYIPETDISKLEIYEIENPDIQFDAQVPEISIEEIDRVANLVGHSIDSNAIGEVKGIPLPIAHSDFEFTNKDIEDDKLSEAEWLRRRLNTILRT